MQLLAVISEAFQVLSVARSRGKITSELSHTCRSTIPGGDRKTLGEPQSPESAICGIYACRPSILKMADGHEDRALLRAEAGYLENTSIRTS